VTIAYSEPGRAPHPVSFDVEHPERLSRVTTFFRLLLAIPQLIATWLLLYALYILTFLAWFGILFTGRYPKAFFEFTTGVLRWQANVVSYAALLRDEYPPFSWEPGAYPLTLDIPYAERQSRLRLFVRVFTIIPNVIALSFVQYAWYFTTFIAWAAILITGRYPRGLFKFSVGVGRWFMRQASYLLLLRDEYPPYSVTAHARPGNEVVSGIIGLPLFGLYVAILVLPAFTGFSDTTAVSRLSLNRPGLLRQARPEASAGGVRLTLLDYDASARPAGVVAEPGMHFVSFTVRAEKSGWAPAFYWPVFVSVQECGSNGLSRGLDTDASRFPFRSFWGGGSYESTLYFQLADGSVPCSLSYFTGRGVIRFEFR